MNLLTPLLLLRYIQNNKSFKERILIFKSTISTLPYSSLNINPSLPGQGENMIAWNITKGIKTAQSALVRMVEYSENNIKLNKFLNLYCKHLIQPLGDNTNISKNTLELNKLDSTKLIPLTARFSHKLTDQVKGKSGVYCFIHNATKSISYIGSATNFSVRLINHYHESRHSNTKFYSFVRKSGGFENFSLIYCHTLTNLVLDYSKLNNINPIENYILRSFVQFEIRMIEQAFISLYKPLFNKETTVIFGFSNWSSNNLSKAQYLNSVAVVAFTEAGKMFEYSSLSTAKANLNISGWAIKQICNCIEPYFVYSSTLKCKVHFMIESLPLKDQDYTPYSLKVEEIKGIDLTKLPAKKVIVYNSDKTTVFGIFNTVVEVIASLKLNEGNQLWRYVNKEYLVESKELGLNFYVVKNPFQNEKLTKECKLINTITGEIKVFENLYDLIEQLGYKRSNIYSFRESYLDTDKLLNKVFKIELIQ